MRTEKTITGTRHWVKITRRVDKAFVFALGYTGELKAYDVKEWSAKWMPTWKDAVAHAEQMIEDWK